MPWMRWAVGVLVRCPGGAAGTPTLSLSHIQRVKPTRNHIHRAACFGCVIVVRMLLYPQKNPPHPSLIPAYWGLPGWGPDCSGRRYTVLVREGCVLQG